MPDVAISFIDEPLKTLLKAGKDYPNSDLDLSVAYVSAVGVSWLRTLLKSAQRIRVVAGLCPINRVSAFEELQDYGADVYVYVAGSRKIFHPKIYYGASNAQAWAMVGSSNLTQNGLSSNIERSLFIAGQRLTVPFASIEAQLESFRAQAYFFDEEVKKRLLEIEKRAGRAISEDEYLARLIDAGIKPKERAESAIPREVQQLALETLFEFARSTRLEYAYQMLLLLVILNRADTYGQILLKEAAYCLSQFYKLRKEAGLPVEKKKPGSKSSAVENIDSNVQRMMRIILMNPFPRFERRGLLDLSEDNQYLVINAALLETLLPTFRDELRSLAIKRLAAHYDEDIASIEVLVTLAIG